MTNNKFQKVVEARINKIYSLLTAKGKEYARNDDRLSNFKRAAAMEQCTPERALRGMLIKHLVSLYDMIDDLEQGIEHPIELWQEKIGDSINYLILLEGLINESNLP